MRAVGIILAGGNNNRMKELTHKRAVAAMPIAGSYRSIDFALSNMTNSHIQKVAVLTQYNARSLNEHLNSSKWWNFGRKQGGLYVFTPTITNDNGYWYRGTADAIYQNMDFLKKSHEPYVVIASGDAVYKMDYSKVLQYHIDKKADVTVVCKEMDPSDDVSRFGTIRMDDDMRITEFEEKPMVTKSNISDLPPAKYNPGASVKNSLVGSGSIINGTVENSVIFKQVFVGNNCVIKNSIILNDVYLGDNTYIENCIVESRDTIRANTRHVGTNGIKVVVEKNERYAL